jgi:hypothetical protein
MKARPSSRVSLSRLLALFHSGFRQNRSRPCLFGFPGFPQGAKAGHVLADIDGLSRDVSHRSRTLFRSQPLPVGARDTLG